MSDIELILIAAGILVLFLLWQYIPLKKQIRSLSRQMEAQTCGASEKMLDISLIDRDLEFLTGILNKYNIRQRQAISGAIRHEEHLKESIANISHDLRTPLTVILGHLQLLENEKLTPKQLQHVIAIRNKAERMKELVETFYDLSVLDEQPKKPVLESFNLSNLLLNLITENAPALEAKGIIPDISLPEYSVYLYSDKAMVERILQNLLTNAIRYSAGMIAVMLEQKENKKILFRIENTVQEGIDIDTERLFERFYTGDKSRHDGSTGLGLAVVQSLVSALNGTITAGIRENMLDFMLEL